MKKTVFLNNPARQQKRASGLSGRQWRKLQKANARALHAAERKRDVPSDT